MAALYQNFRFGFRVIDAAIQEAHIAIGQGLTLDWSRQGGEWALLTWEYMLLQVLKECPSV